MPVFQRDLMGRFAYELTSEGKFVDFTTGKLLPYHPEEPVRQWYERILVNTLGYSKDQMDVEVEIPFGSKSGYADIVVYEDRSKRKMRLIVEAKRPNRIDGRTQLDTYLSAKEVEFGVWTNGQSIEYVYHASRQVFDIIPEIPRNGETIHDITNRLTRSKLQPAQDLRRELIECEDFIVGSQGGLDVFDELFKMIFAKIYDENKNLVKDSSIPEFRASVAESPSITAIRMKKLFEKAREEFSDVFDTSDQIRLSDENVHRVTMKLQTLDLFHTDLDVLGEGFEVLIPSKMKLSKGQYFTPRQLVRLAVKIMGPDETCRVLDPACGSGGFLIYCMKYVWQKIEEKRKGDLLGIQREQIRFASEQLYGLDYDDRLVRVAVAYMTIAGDGSSNVKKVIDSLKPYDWELDIQRRFTNVDLLFTNPPFAGDYDLRLFAGDRGLDFVYANHPLAVNNGKRLVKQRKDILFIEKCIEWVKLGTGKIGIVLPKGDLDERNKKYVRDYIKRNCKILAVIALHEDMFAPYTGQKTSLVVLQRYPKPLDSFEGVDYPIFMAVSERPGKDKSGDPVFKRAVDGEIILDEERKPILDTDLDQVADDYLKNETPSVGFYVNFSQLQERINAEYYQPKYETIENALSSQPVVLSVNQIKEELHNGIDVSQHSAIRQRVYVTRGRPYLRVGDVYENFIDTANAEKIPDTMASVESKFVATAGDILVTRKGTTGRVAVVTKADEGAIISSEIIRLSLKQRVIATSKDGKRLTIEIDPYYIAAFLNSEIGRLQIEQKRTGGISQGINHPDLKTVEIPILGEDVQKRIVEMYRSARDNMIKATELNKTALSEFSKRLGLSRLEEQPSIDRAINRVDEAEFDKK